MLLPIFNLVFGIFTSIGTFMVAQVGAKLAIRIAVVAAWLAAFGVFTAAVAAVLGSLQSGMPAPVAWAMGFLPGNTGACVAAVIATQGAATVYTQVTAAASVKGAV